MFRVLEGETGAGLSSRAGAEALSRSQKKLAVEEGQGDAWGDVNFSTNKREFRTGDTEVAEKIPELKEACVD